MKKRSEKDILEKAVPGLSNKAEICRDGVWLPVSIQVYEKIKELLRTCGNTSIPLRGDFRLTVILQQKGLQRAIIITSTDMKDAIKEGGQQ